MDAGQLIHPAQLLQQILTATTAAATGTGAGAAVAAASSAAAAPVAGVGARHLVGWLSAKTAALIASALAATGVAATVLVTLPPGDHDRATPRSWPSVPVLAPGSVEASATAAATTTVPGSTSGAEPVAGPAAIFLAPNGDDAGDGSLAKPYATLAKAVSVAKPGQIIYMRGGTYRPTQPVEITTSGTGGQPITLTEYRGERPVFDAALAPAGSAFITQHADHWIVHGLEIINARHLPYVCESCRYDTFQSLMIHDNRGTGFTLRGQSTIGNQILDSDFYGNHDDAGAAADGLAIVFGSGTGNLVRGCRTYDNVDDGVKIGQFTDSVTIDATWSYGNGVNRWNLPRSAARVTDSASVPPTRRLP